MRAISAAMMLLGAVALLWVLGDSLWSRLSELRRHGDLLTASPSSPADPAAGREPNAAGVTTVRSQSPAGAIVVPAEESDIARTPSSPEATTRAAPGEVRFVEGQGIVGPRLDGPLVRLPAMVKEAPPPPPPVAEPDLYRLVVIESAGVIDARSHIVRLAHVAAPDTSATCRNAAGASWPCGMRARTALRRLIRRRAIACTDPDWKPGEEKRPPPRQGEMRVEACTVGGVDLAQWLVENGWAEPAAGAPEEWQALNDAAKAEGRGLYDAAGR